MAATQLDDAKLAALRHYADCLGLAFQVIDDVLDVEASTEQLGKSRGADAAMGKSTCPDLLGLRESRQLAENLCQEGIVSIAMIGDNTDHLVAVANAVDPVKQAARWQTEKPGGSGGVRELCDLILSTQNKVELALEKYLNP